MTDGFDMSEYLDVFLQEADDQLLTLEENMVKLEQEDAPQDVLQAIFRAAHTLKGASASMGFTQLAEVTHILENVLDALRNEQIKTSTDLVDATFKALDCMRALKEEAAQGVQGTVPDEVIQDTLTSLKTILAESQGDRMEAQEAGGGPVGMELAAHDMETISEAVERGYNVFQVHIKLKEGCPLKGIRAALIVNDMNDHGEVVKTAPPSEDLEEERFDHEFVALTVTQSTETEIMESVKKLAEIDEVSVEAVKADEVVAAQDKADDEAAEAADAAEAAVAAAAEEAGDPDVKPAAAAADAPAQQAQGGPSRQVATVRVNVEQLDNLMNYVAELVIDRTMLEQIRASLAQQRGTQDDIVARLEESVSGIRRRTTELQEEIMKARLLPIANVFNRFPRMVRDLAKKAGKEIDFQVSGGETELDRSVLEFIADPLIHILRNAVDHGIEPPDVREEAGKPRKGAVDLNARHEENHIVIEVTDDGRGIDPEKVKAAAIRRGQLTEEVAARMSRREVYDLIFAPGTSTADQITDVSGRGVGMDIVKTNIERLNGQIDIQSQVGVGTTMAVRLPLTLAIIQALMVSSRQRIYAIPLSAVEETERRPRSDVDTVRGRETITVRDKVIPLIDLSGALSYSREVPPPEESDQLYIVVVSVGEKLAGLIVDRLVGEQEVVIKSLGKFIGEIHGISGATILGDGTVALIVDVGALLNRVVDEIQQPALA
ncbi:MAG: chemotaxis protein CheA [Armatimonadia bacterium]|nr:chemotaxis protein CheA [Armatimonadia bacterium]